MMDKVSILIFGIAIGMFVGSFLTIAICSLRPLCPRRMEKRLSRWNRQIERENHARRWTLKKSPQDDDPDKAA